MMSDYNGYPNYETWNVALWIDNDEGEQDYWIRESERADSIHELEDELKDYFQENMPVVTGTYADLLQAALDEVNWYYLAEMFWEEYHKEEEEEEITED